MSRTTSPSTEACQAIIDRLNTGTAYVLGVAATYAEHFCDDVEDMEGLIVDVIPLDEVQLEETLSIEDRTSHQMGVEIRKKLNSLSQAAVDQLKLVVRQLYHRVNNFNSADGRVRVWQAAFDDHENPNKKLLTDSLVFRARLLLRVEVEASA